MQPGSVRVSRSWSRNRSRVDPGLGRARAGRGTLGVVRFKYLLAAAAVVAALLVGLLGVERVSAQREAAQRAASHDTLCFVSDAFERPEGGSRFGVMAVGVVAVLGARHLVRASRR